MQHLQSILSVTFPFFALVFCGYLATRRGLFPLQAIPGLGSFVLYFALSAMLFRFAVATPFRQLFDLPLVLLYSGCGILLVLLTVWLSRNERIGIRDAAFGAMVTAFPNSGFMGIPLILALLGEQAVGGVIVTLLVDSVLISSLCLAIAHLPDKRAADFSAEDEAETLLTSFGRALRGATANPLPWAIAAGVLFALSGWTMPVALDKTIALLSDAASPVALFAMGAILARNAMKGGPASPPKDYVPLALAKLFLHPLLVFAAALGMQRLGFAFDPRTLLAVTLVAALPGASNVSMLAERFSVDSGRIANVIMVSTVLSFFTFAAMVWLLGVPLAGL